MLYDYLVVGAGLFGATFSHEMKKQGKRILAIDSRNHVGGNIYTEYRQGINVHVFGPHIFHTNDGIIWNYINQFATFNHFVNSPKARVDNKLYSLPINLNTLYQFWGVTTPNDAIEKLNSVKIPCPHPNNLEDWILSQVGRELYETLILGYTLKQWKKHPKELPASIIKRLPIRLTFNDNYYDDIYQGIPFGGYTPIIEKMLDGITVKLNTPFQEIADWRKLAKKLVYTGRIDEYFQYQFGDLEYRTLDFEHVETIGDYQGNAIINYPQADIPFTRIIEHKHFQFGKQQNTIYTREYPTEWSREKIPYYPVNTEQNNSLYQKYKKLAQTEPDVIFSGRLGSFKYIDMDVCIALALNLVQKELN